MDRFLAWLMVVLLPLHAQAALAFGHCAHHARDGIAATSLHSAGHSEPTWAARFARHPDAGHDAGHRHGRARVAWADATGAVAGPSTDSGDVRGSAPADEDPSAGATCALAAALVPAALEAPAAPGRDRVRADPSADAPSADTIPPRPPPRAAHG